MAHRTWNFSVLSRIWTCADLVPDLGQPNVSGPDPSTRRDIGMLHLQKKLDPELLVTTCGLDSHPESPTYRNIITYPTQSSLIFRMWLVSGSIPRLLGGGASVPTVHMSVSNYSLACLLFPSSGLDFHFLKAFLMICIAEDSKSSAAQYEARSMKIKVNLLQNKTSHSRREMTLKSKKRARQGLAVKSTTGSKHMFYFALTWPAVAYFMFYWSECLLEIAV
jgi:hypothetical protein